MLRDILHSPSGTQQDSTVIRHVPFYRSRASPEHLVGAVEPIEPDWQVCIPLAGSNRS